MRTYTFQRSGELVCESVSYSQSADKDSVCLHHVQMHLVTPKGGNKMRTASCLYLLLLCYEVILLLQPAEISLSVFK